MPKVCARFGLLFSQVLFAAVICAAEPLPAYRNTASGVAYTGSKACAGCHKTIYEKFVRTPMGKSLTPAAASGFPLPARVEIPALNRNLEVFEEDGRMFQTETETAAGKTTFTNTQELAWSIGSGENGMTFVVRRGGYLFEAPLSYYTKARRWDLSPGYETADEGFSRPIANACLVCHSGRTQPIAGREGMYSDLAFTEPSVGCENCHGPAQIHVTERTRGSVKSPDTSIVNPARLPSRLAEDICMMCHQGGQVRVLLPGQEYSGFRPGTPLIRTVAIAESAGRVKDSALLEHHDSMQISRCFEASSGKLGCLTCHDPHEQPDADAAPAYFRAKCLTCHKESSCRLAPAARRASVPPDNCAGCHMPRREVGIIAHSALTDHRIPARPDQGSPGTLPAMGGIAGVRVLNSRQGDPELPLITRLEILGTLRDRDPRLSSEYSVTLEEAARQLPDEPLVAAVLGRAALSRGSPDAVQFLARAEKAEMAMKGAVRASTYIDLGDAYLQAALPANSTAALERGQEAYPWSKEIRKRLVLSYIRQKDYVKSAAALKKYVADFPEDSFMRRLLNQLEPRP